MRRNMVRCLLTLLLFSFMLSHAFADEPTSSPDQQLQNIIELLQGDSRQEALRKLEIQDDDLATYVQGSKDAELYMLLSRAYYYAEMDTKAIETFNSALQLDLSISDAYFYIGLIHRYANDLDAAEKSLRDAIKTNAKDEKYFLELGRTLVMKEDLSKASTAYKNALALNKESFDANFNLATIYAMEDDVDNAEKHFFAAIEQDPSDLVSHYNLGQLYQNILQHKLAIEQFEKVVELNPNDWRAIAKLVQGNEALNNYPARNAAIESIYEIWRMGNAPIFSGDLE